MVGEAVVQPTELAATTIAINQHRIKSCCFHIRPVESALWFYTRFGKSVIDNAPIAQPHLVLQILVNSALQATGPAAGRFM